LGAVVFGIGWMLASVHCSGTVDVTRERLKRSGRWSDRRLMQLYTEKPGWEGGRPDP